MVLACTDEDTTAVDLHSGAIVRLRIEWGQERRARPRPPGDRRRRVGRRPRARRPGPARGRDRDRRPLGAGHRRGAGGPGGCCATSPSRPSRTCSGFAGSSAPYWEFRGMRPSVAVVVPSRGPGGLPSPRRRHGVGALRLAPQRQLAPHGGPPGHRGARAGPARPPVGQGPRSARSASGPTSSWWCSAGRATGTATRPWRRCCPGPERG